MKRIISLLLCMALLAIGTVYAFADVSVWYCPTCGTELSGDYQYCYRDGTARPDDSESHSSEISYDWSTQSETETQSNHGAGSTSALYRQASMFVTVDDFMTVAAYIKPGRREIAYSGPGKNYTRGANGKAYSDTANDTIYVYGKENGWVLIRYNVGSEYPQWRFAYISCAAFSDDPEIPDLNFDKKQCVIVKQCFMTDDPISSKNELIKLQEGEVITYLAKMGQWAYIEANNTRGFVMMECLSDYMK